MKHKKISTIWLITGACFLVAIIAWSLSGSKEKETINFTTEPVSLGNIRNSITATGTVSPVDTVAVGTQVSGIIDKIYVDFNTPVKKGQILAVLDTKNLSSQLNSAKANVLCVPTKALRYTPTKETVGKRKIRDISNAKNKVWTIEGNTLVAHRVSIGSSDGTNTQIISGIKQGQKVITGVSVAGDNSETGNNGSESSPFAPGPPNRNKKK